MYKTGIDFIQYPILKRAAEKKLLQSYKLNPDTKIRDKIILHNMRLVLSIVLNCTKDSSYNSTFIDDLIQEGVWGLIRALETFDTSRNLKFSTYACWWVRVKIQRYLQKEYTSLGFLEKDPSKIDDFIYMLSVDRESNACSIDDKELLEHILKTLSEKDRIFIELKYGMHTDVSLNGQEMADLFGVTRQAINLKEIRILKQLRNNLTIAEQKGI